MLWNHVMEMTWEELMGELRSAVQGHDWAGAAASAWALWRLDLARYPQEVRPYVRDHWRRARFMSTWETQMRLEAVREWVRFGLAQDRDAWLDVLEDMVLGGGTSPSNPGLALVPVGGQLLPPEDLRHRITDKLATCPTTLLPA